MVIAQIVLLSQWFSKKAQYKKPTKKTQSKQSGPKQLVQNGILVKLDMEAKTPYGGFLTEILIKNAVIYYSKVLAYETY